MIDLNNPEWIYIDFRRFQDQRVWRPVAGCGGLWRDFRAGVQPLLLLVCEPEDLQTTSQRTCRLPDTMFGVLAGWMADDLRELRGVRLVAEGLAGW